MCILKELSAESSPLRFSLSHIDKASTQSDSADVAVEVGGLFRQASGLEEQGEVAVKDLEAKPAVAPAVSPGDIHAHKRLSVCGVDSLIAVELRN